MIPELLFVVLLRVDLRVQGLHHPDYHTGLLASFRPVRNCLDLLDHIQDDAAIFRHLKFLPLRVVVEFYRVVVRFHNNFHFVSKGKYTKIIPPHR